MKLENKPASYLVYWFHQVIYNILVTKYLSKIVFDFIYPLDDIINYISWEAGNDHNCTLQSTKFQYVFVRDMIFDLVLIIDWNVITNDKNVKMTLIILFKIFLESDMNTK